MNHKIICIGANLESYKSLTYLLENGCKIHSLITLPVGENKYVSDYVDLHPLCEKYGVNVIDTKNVNSKETIEALRRIAPDYLFTLGWSQIFKKELIQCFSGFIVGTHPSKLPKGRGRAPVPWTIIEDWKESAVSFFKIDEGIDTGKLFFQKNFIVPDRAYAMDVYQLVSENLGKGFYDIYTSIKNGEQFSFQAQDDTQATHRGKRTSSDGLIEFDKKVGAMDKLIRAVSKPFPGAYCYYRDSKVIFWEVDLEKDHSYFGTLGQIHKKAPDGILVQFADGNLWLKKPADELGNPIELDFFKVGTRLGYNLQDEIYYLKKMKNND